MVSGYRTIPVSSADKPHLHELEDLVDLALSAVNERLLDTKCVPSDGNHWPGYLLKKRNNLLALLVLADPDLASPWEWGLRDLRYIIGTMDGSSGYTQPKNFLDSGGWYWWDGSYMEYPYNTDLVKGYQAVDSLNIWTLAGLANYSYPATPPFTHKLVPNEFATLLSQLKVLASPIFNYTEGSQPPITAWTADAGSYLASSSQPTKAAAFANLVAGGSGSGVLGWTKNTPSWGLKCTQQCSGTINTNTGDAAWTADSLSGCKLLIASRTTTDMYGSNCGPSQSLDVYVGGTKVGTVTADNVIVYNYGGFYAWLDVALSLINFSGNTTVSLRIPTPTSPPPGYDDSQWAESYLYKWDHLPAAQFYFERAYNFTS
jgi:hypothetical protein